MSIELLTFLMFGAMLSLIALGLPISFTLGGIGVIFSMLAWGPDSLNLIVLKAFDLMNAQSYVAIPLFIFMAYMLEKAGVAEELYEVMHRWMGPLKGGLTAGTIIGGTVVAAMSGISTTGVVLMGIIGLPSMLKKGYDKKLVMGSIMACGTLGMLIPPSLMMIVYALVSGESIGKLFIAGVCPGLMVSSIFIGYTLLRAQINPNLGPPVPQTERVKLIDKLIILKSVIIPGLLVVAVLGSIFLGLATPTEAAGVGAAGTIASAAFKRRLNFGILKEVSHKTLQTVAMVMWIVFAADCFAAIYQGIGASKLILGIISAWPVSKWVIMALIQFTWLIMGCLMDSISILMITAPIFLPIAEHLGFDLLWFGILFIVNCEMDLMTPPFGVNLMVMKGIAPKGTDMVEIYLAALPFVGLQILSLILLILFPEIVTWLPDFVFTHR
jgi:tripartite ATP-independent transporter DctM subunit